MRRRFTIVLGAFICIASTPLSAKDDDYKAVFEALFSHMALTYMCRDALGGSSHYQAARSIAISTASQMLGRAEAIRGVDEMDKKLKNDPRAARPDMPEKFCIEQTNEGLFQIQVAKQRADLID